MKTIITISIILLLIGSLKAKSFGAKAQEDKRFAEISEHITRTTTEGLEILNRALKLKPEVNERLSTKSLGEHVEEFSSGSDPIKPIGWEVVRNRAMNRWRIVFYYQMNDQSYRAAEWEYNDETKKLYPFEFVNSPTFWAGEKR